MGFKVAQIFEMAAMPDYGELLKQAGIEAELVKKICPLSATEEEVIAATHDADIIIGIATFQPFTRKVIERLRNCKFIMSVGIGYEKLDVKAATEHGILAANVPDYCLEELTDHTMALILALTRKIVELNNAVRFGKWQSGVASGIQQIWPQMDRLCGRTLGIIAFGRAARALVPKAKGFGLRVIACDPYVAPNVFAELGVERVELDQLLKESDIVSINAALTPGTEHLLGSEQFKIMKPGAYLVNTARGGIVDEQALYAALAGRHIAGAGLDVTDPEPPAADSPLLKLDNVIITAHSAAASPMAFGELWHRPVEEIIRLAGGEWPRGLISTEVKDKFIAKWGRVGV